MSLNPLLRAMVRAVWPPWSRAFTSAPLLTRNCSARGKPSEGRDVQLADRLWTSGVQFFKERPVANIKQRVAENVSGDFFVDSTCIDCDACRQIAPETFGQASETSYVQTQPREPQKRRQAI